MASVVVVSESGNPRNGRLGAMVCGRVRNERVSSNKNSLWSGGPRNTDNPEAFLYLEEVRRAEGHYPLAEELADRHLTSVVAQLSREVDAHVEAVAPDTLTLVGRCDGGNGMRFETRLKAVAERGITWVADGKLHVIGAEATTFLLSAATRG